MEQVMPREYYDRITDMRNELEEMRNTEPETGDLCDETIRQIRICEFYLTALLADQDRRVESNIEERRIIAERDSL